MSDNPSVMAALKTVICDALLADETVLAALGGKPHVFDISPRVKSPDEITPYIYVGAVGGKYESRHGADITMNVRLRLYVVTDEPDRDDVWKIAETIAPVLNEKTLAMPAGYSMDMLMLEDVGDVIDPLTAQMAFMDFRCTADYSAL